MLVYHLVQGFNIQCSNIRVHVFTGINYRLVPYPVLDQMRFTQNGFKFSPVISLNCFDTQVNIFKQLFFSLNSILLGSKI